MEHWSWKEYSPPACLGFGWRYHQFPSYPVDLPFHLERSRFKIQVIPLEGTDFATAQTGGQLQQEQLVAAILSASSKSSHWRPQISPRRRPVDSSGRSSS